MYGALNELRELIIAHVKLFMTISYVKIIAFQPLTLLLFLSMVRKSHCSEKKIKNDDREQQNSVNLFLRSMHSKSKKHQLEAILKL